MPRLKRLWELISLFFQYLGEEGISETFHRAAGFFRRRLRRKKGRFTPPREDLSRQRYYVPDFQNRTISVVTSLYNTDPAFLEEFVGSFLSQSYSFGQLVLADASDVQHGYVGDYIKSLNSPKIKYFKLENRGISSNTNRAVAQADGDYICFADHDDILSPDALFRMAKRVNDTGADLVYSDEALFDKDWQDPIVPHFKPDFSYYYLTNCNYICHFVCVKKSIYQSLGGLSPDCDGAQDQDFLLKVSEIPGVKISHIPMVLYYWRVHSGSTSKGMEAKPYVTERAVRALDSHLSRIQVSGKARAGEYPGTYKIDYRIEDPPLISIIIPNKDRAELLQKCVGSIYAKTDYKKFEIIIVENNSVTEEIFNLYDSLQREHKNLSVVKFRGPFNFSSIVNFGAKKADGSILLLLNNDIEINSASWLSEMAQLCIQPRVGIVGAKLLYPDGRVQHGGVITGLGGYAGHSHKFHSGKGSGYMFRLSCVQNLSCVTGACLMVKKDVFLSRGGFDERFRVAFNDVDFCLRVQDLGYQVLFTPYAVCTHRESVTRGYDKKGESKDRFRKEKALLKGKFGDRLIHDPFYNPNLTLDMEDFSESRVLPEYGKYL